MPERERYVDRPAARSPQNRYAAHSCHVDHLSIAVLAADGV